MRTVELAKVAGNAEKLRIRTLVKRQTNRAIFGVVAAIFALGLLVLLHVLVFQLLAPYLNDWGATLALIAIDLIVVIVCAVIALRSKESVVETEALEIRRQALREMRRTATILSMVGPAGRLLGGRRSTGLALGALATRLLARR